MPVVSDEAAVLVMKHVHRLSVRGKMAARYPQFGLVHVRTMATPFRLRVKVVKWSSPCFSSSKVLTWHSCKARAAVADFRLVFSCMGIVTCTVLGRHDLCSLGIVRVQTIKTSTYPFGSERV